MNGITQINSKNFSKAPKLAIVLPCFNERESIEHVVIELTALIEKLVRERLISKNSYLFFVDDGSSDESWSIIEKFNSYNKAIKGLKLSRNFGHQVALLAGLSEVTKNCDIAVTIDSDLQQDPLAIRDFVAEFHNGADIVIGVRKDRGKDGWLKKLTALGFYRFMSLMGVYMVPNHADYRLLSKRALEALALFPEANIFLRATCLHLGFKIRTVFFDVNERKYGQTKYSISKMLQLALHGITSFSVTPLRIIAITGFVIFLTSFVMGGYVIWHKLFLGDSVPGWASTTLPIYFIGGLQLLFLGVIGEYVGQIYKMVKNRPRWISEHKLD
ncbi:WcaA Glycosyltransferases involved in cell wall biogenesis [Candidatus Methylopumilus universalis]|uniref:glycosyltransferase family 2 protein n=1 Tax=Candidatus Methylopumilus universalis TaxID=2588536 RepID=UPI003BEF19F6